MCISGATVIGKQGVIQSAVFCFSGNAGCIGAAAVNMGIIFAVCICFSCLDVCFIQLRVVLVNNFRLYLYSAGAKQGVFIS